MPLKNNFNYLSPFGRLMFLGGLMIFGTLIAMGAFYACNEIFWGYPMHQLSYLSMESDSQIVWAAKFLQIFSQIGLFIIPALVFSFLISEDPMKELGISEVMNSKSFVFVLILTLLSIPFINLLAIWNSAWHLPDFLGFAEEWMRTMQLKNDILLEVMLQMNSHKDIAINLLMVVILPAVGEELIFRGVIQKQLYRWLQNPHVAIIITAIFFSAFHMQFLGFLSRFLLGMIFGYFYYYSKNLWTSIWAHFVNNGLALSLAIIYGNELEQSASAESLGLKIILLSCLCLGIAFFTLFYKKEHLFRN